MIDDWMKEQMAEDRDRRMRKFVYDYYKVSIPRDFSQKEAADLAISTAEHRTQVCAIPQLWTAELTDYTEFDWIFKVRRKRHWHPKEIR